MKMAFFAFLIVAAGFLLYAPGFVTGRSAVVQNTVQPAAAVNPDDSAVSGARSQSMNNLKSELGIDADKPLVEESAVIPPAAEKLMHGSQREASTIEKIRAAAPGFYAGVLDSVRYLFSEHGSDIIALAIIILVGAIVSKCTGFYNLSYLLCRLGWFFSRFSLALFSAASILFYFVSGKNLWRDAGGASFLIPLAMLAASSAAFKIMDSNYPVWNRLFGSFVLPIISGIIVNAASVSRIVG